MLDLFQCAFQNLMRKKSRTWLTILSIAVGVASVVLISSVKPWEPKQSIERLTG